jgi:hypothetical protein
MSESEGREVAIIAVLAEWGVGANSNKCKKACLHSCSCSKEEIRKKEIKNGKIPVFILGCFRHCAYSTCTVQTRTL